MGEYTKRLSDRQEIKIGTCESMYYLRWDDIDKVASPGYSLREPGFWFRLPFPDEDDIGPGGYDTHDRGYRLLPYQAEDDPAPTLFEVPDPSPGLLQVYHSNSGLLLNVKCHHNQKLPEASADITPFFNGKDPYPWELYMVKNHPGEGLLPLVRCRHCREVFRLDWARVLPHIADQTLRDRLTDYAAALV